jgi:hypothetical protein
MYINVQHLKCIKNNLIEDKFIYIVLKMFKCIILSIITLSIVSIVSRALLSATQPLTSRGHMRDEDRSTSRALVHERTKKAPNKWRVGFLRSHGITILFLSLSYYAKKYSYLTKTL